MCLPLQALTAYESSPRKLEHPPPPPPGYSLPTVLCFVWIVSCQNGTCTIMYDTLSGGKNNTNCSTVFYSKRHTSEEVQGFWIAHYNSYGFSYNHILRVRAGSSINPQIRQPRMPHAMAPRMSHIWYHADRHEQWKRVTSPVFLLRT